MEIVIIGAGGHGAELYSYLQDLIATGSQLHSAGFIDDGKPPGPWCDTRILGDFRDLQQLLRAHGNSSFGYITAVGNNEIRRTLVERVNSLRAPNLQAWPLIHPRAVLGRDVAIGQGTCAAPGSIVTTRVRIGSHCILNVKVSVSHDCTIGDFVNLNPAVTMCGNVIVGDGAYIGAGATIKDGVTIGAGATVGAGAVVIDDVPPDVTVVGVPARIIKHAQLAAS